ncbi:DHBP synthase RibB-like alpha/beta domain-containing protein [Tribonema minus]|uniref:Threonylcarbamoyl-AMP synthase n=1 Tax=Tribonema minus TaxID=303371 RepID=A0A835YZP2_9STRA|nr:DHBP synthase RibB-like alpha/beta domain-containing protein [Tribonema minus]
MVRCSRQLAVACCLACSSRCVTAFTAPLQQTARTGKVRTSTTVCRAAGTKSRGAAASKCLQVEVDPEGFDNWKLAPIIETLQNGGVGVLPTDTCYVFACDVHSRRGVDRIFQLKQYVGKRKPLSLLCKDISTISKHSDGIDKDLFKVLKRALPGPYTFIVPATHQARTSMSDNHTARVPRMLLDHKSHKKTWKRREVGVRIPDQPVLHAVLEALENPLICSSVPARLSNAPHDDDDDFEEDQDDDAEWSKAARAQLATDPQQIADAWGHAVDFIVNAGPITSAGVSTVVNCMARPPEVLRQGLGDPGLLGL